MASAQEDAHYLYKEIGRYKSGYEKWKSRVMNVVDILQDKGRKPVAIYNISSEVAKIMISEATGISISNNPFATIYSGHITILKKFLEFMGKVEYEQRELDRVIRQSEDAVSNANAFVKDFLPPDKPNSLQNANKWEILESIIFRIRIKAKPLYEAIIEDGVEYTKIQREEFRSIIRVSHRETEYMLSDLYLAHFQALQIQSALRVAKANFEIRMSQQKGDKPLDTVAKEVITNHRSLEKLSEKGVIGAFDIARVNYEDSEEIITSTVLKWVEKLDNLESDISKVFEARGRIKFRPVRDRYNSNH